MHGPDIITVAHATGRTVLEVARAFFLLGERLELDWLEKQVEAMPAGSRWQRWALQSMEDDLFTLRRSLAETVLDECSGLPIDEAVEKFLESRDDAFAPSPAVHAEPRGRRHGRPRAAHGGAAADPRRLIG